MSGHPKNSKNNQKVKYFNLECLHVITCSMVGIACFPLLILVTLFILIYRAIVGLILKINYKDKLTLVSPSDAIFAEEKYANTTTVNFFLYIKGTADIQKIQRKLVETLTSCNQQTGYQKYQKLMFRVTKKFGFYCWEDRRDTFKIHNHVKFYPEAGFQTYTEQEVLEIAEKLIDTPLSLYRDKPQWELLIVPKVKLSVQVRKHDTDSPYHAFIFRLYHPYMDGMSTMEFFHKGMCDEPGIPIKNHINLITPKLSILKLCIHYTQIFLLGPHEIYKATRTEPNSVFQVGTENRGPKFIECTKTGITIESVKKIRKAFDCTTTDVFNSVFSGALRKAAERKGLSVPDVTRFGFSKAILSYPINDEPQNRFMIASMTSSMSPKNDPVERLKRNSTTMKSLRGHEISTFYWLGRLVGLFPAQIIKLIFSNVRVSYAITNLPGFSRKLRLNGNTIEEMFGCPPIKNGLGFAIGVSSYIDNFRVCCLAEKSRVVSCREDMEKLMADVENELKSLEFLANEIKNNI